MIVIELYKGRVGSLTRVSALSQKLGVLSQDLVYCCKEPFTTETTLNSAILSRKRGSKMRVQRANYSRVHRGTFNPEGGLDLDSWKG